MICQPQGTSRAERDKFEERVVSCKPGLRNGFDLQDPAHTTFFFFWSTSFAPKRLGTCIGMIAS